MCVWPSPLSKRLLRLMSFDILPWQLIRLTTVEPLATPFADLTTRSRKLHLAYWWSTHALSHTHTLTKYAKPWCTVTLDRGRLKSSAVVFVCFSVWMPSLSVMELSRQLCGKMRRSNRKAQYSSSPTTTWGLEIHFYLPGVHQLEYTTGCFTAEQLCVDAAKKCCKWISCWLLLVERD